MYMYGRWSEENTAELLALCAQGLSVAEIADIIGCTIHAVDSRVRKLMKQGQLDKAPPRTSPQFSPDKPAPPKMRTLPLRSSAPMRRKPTRPVS